MKEIAQIHFSGGMKVEAQMNDTLIKADQPVNEGGEGSAPQPFQLFLASIATCAAAYAAGFCEARKLSTDGMSLSMSGEFGPDNKLYTKLSLHLTLPEGFPEKYRASILRVMDLCAVKKQIVKPPEFEITAG